MKLIDKYDMYHGGFIWDFIDQAILVKDQVTGKEVLRYGGDFDDKPADYEFSANGIVFADRKEKPAMQEVRYYYGLIKVQKWQGTAYLAPVNSAAAAPSSAFMLPNAPLTDSTAISGSKILIS